MRILVPESCNAFGLLLFPAKAFDSPLPAYMLAPACRFLFLEKAGGTSRELCQAARLLVRQARVTHSAASTPDR